MSRDVKRRQEMSRYVKRCQDMSRDVKRCQEMSRDVKRCQEMSGDVKRGQEMSIDVRRCQERSIPVKRCQEMSRDVKRCQDMSRYVKRCQEMSRDVKRRQEMSRYVKICQEMSRDVKRCQEMSRDVKRCQERSRPVKRCQEMSRDVKRRQEMSRDVKRRQERSRDVKRRQEMSRDVNRCHSTSRDVKRCQEMSRDVRRCQGMSRDVKRCQEASNLDQLRLSRCLCLAEFAVSCACVLACMCGCARELWHQRMTDALKMDSIRWIARQEQNKEWVLETWRHFWDKDLQRDQLFILIFWHFWHNLTKSAKLCFMVPMHPACHHGGPIGGRALVWKCRDNLLCTCLIHLIIFAHSSSIFLGIRTFCIKWPWTETALSGCSEDDLNKLPADEIVVSKDPEERKRKLKAGFTGLASAWMRRAKKYSYNHISLSSLWYKEQNMEKRFHAITANVHGELCLCSEAGDTNWMCPASGLSPQRWMHRPTRSYKFR